MRIKVRESFARHKANTKKYAHERLYGNLFTIFEEDEREAEISVLIFTQQYNSTEEESEDEEMGAFVLLPTQEQEMVLQDGVLGVIAVDASDSLSSSSNI